MNIIIGADLVPTKSNYESFEKGDTKEIFGDELEQLLNESDYKIFNLEVPVTDGGTPIKKAGPSLRVPVSAFCGIKKLGIDLFAMANNHILDYGISGLENTEKILDDNNISHIGTGKNLSDAYKPYVFDWNNKKIGVYACAEHEFSIATENLPGANPFDPLESLDHISNLKNECDYLIVLYHGGREFYRYPSPNLQRRCRKMIEKGADLVVCQHSHCVGCEEKYENGTIVYGQGNFIFDLRDDVYWQTSILINIDENFEISYIPLKKEKNFVRMAKGSDADEIMAGFEKRSEEISKEGAVEKIFDEYVKEHGEKILFRLCNSNIIRRVIDKLSKGKYRNFYNKRKYFKHKYSLINWLECEPYNEILMRYIKKFL